MPFIMPHRPYFIDRKAIRTELGIGVLLLGLGLVGIVEPHFIGLNLNSTHGLILDVAGVIAIWGATSHHYSRGFFVNTGLGLFFATLAFTGPYLKDVSDSLTFSRVDHIAHFLFAILFLALSLTWKRYQK
jgi:uncharacterized membrane protein HdeD (DUF308 family)